MPADAPTMVQVPGGPVTLRDTRSGRTRDMEMHPFQLGSTPVTRAQFLAVQPGGGAKSTTT